ncbi:MAG: diguanylate cyclase [Pseudomonadota bacterium]
MPKLAAARSAFDEARFVQAAESARGFLAQDDIEPSRAAQAMALEGAALVQLGLYRDGLDALRLSINLHLEHDQREKTGFAHNYIGIAHEELGDLQQAYQNYEQALALANHTADRSLQARVLANMGDAMASEGRFDDALKQLERAARQAEQSGENAMLGWIEGARARALAAKGDVEAAGEWFASAIAHCHQDKETRSEAEILLHFSDYLASLGHQTQALENLNSALRIFRAVNARSGVGRAHEKLAQLAEEMGDFEAALTHFREYHQVQTDMLEELATERVQSMVNQRDLERAQMERAVSHLRNVELAEALKEVEAQKAELERLSIRDPLTGTYNRRYLDSCLGKEYNFAERHGTALSLAVLDLDHFKQVNDQYSHTVGDEVLKQLVELLLDRVRTEDVLARFGGEEFVLVMPGTDEAGSVRACEKLRVAVERCSWEALESGLKVTISIGVADNQGTCGWSEMMSKADRRLYRAKDAGRNQVFPRPENP